MHGPERQEPEPRAYILQGELLPAAWEAMVAELGSAGLRVVRLNTHVLESSGIVEQLGQDPLPRANQEDFRRFAKATDTAHVVAGRSWNALARFYLHTNDPQPKAHTPAAILSRYYSGLPPLFDIGPTPEEARIRPQHNATRVQDLRVTSLEALIRRIDGRVEKEGARQIPLALGAGNREAVLEFLRAFTRHWRETYSGKPDAQPGTNETSG